MKYFKHSVLFALVSLFSFGAFAQDGIDLSDEDNPYLTSEVFIDFDSIVFNLSNNPRTFSILRSMKGSPEDVQWSRVVYRYIPLRKTEANDDFLYIFPEITTFNERIANPSEPLAYKQHVNDYSVNRGYYYSLMEIILKLLNDGKINAYKYKLKAIDESFLADEKHTRDEVIKKLQEQCGITPKTVNGKPTIDKTEIGYAANQIVGFELKEMWYFDARSSEYGSQVLGIAPIIKEDKVINNLFWISYEELYPYLTLLYVNNPSKKNDLTLSYASFFSRKLYQGYVYRLPNPYGNTVIDGVNEQSSDPATQRAAWKQISDKIDAQLKDFAGNELWALPNDPEILLPESVKKANAKKRADEAAKKAASNPAPAASTSEQPKIATAPVEPATTPVAPVAPQQQTSPTE